MKREDELFLHALDLSAGERAAYLDEACGDNTSLRARLERLLRASAAEDELIDQPVAARPPLPSEEKAGDVIDRYTLVRPLGHGGCGVVWLAEQTAPVRRQVALKVIKLGMDTTSVITRFEAERQALALMDHPGIARVYDAGATALGRPFFVMEFVDGAPITAFCDAHNLALVERLQLFVQVCEAIQHAHQKGIIHRDVKPSNVLVTMVDGVATPKVIDFGIAKATEGRLSDATMVTQLGQFMGTPAYMSPEQAEPGILDIDTRADVYSLGVLLYELLTGLPPFEPQALLAVGLEQMRKQIREVDPPRPSTRLFTLDPVALRTTATRRLIDPPKLVSRISGDLDWIVMRCLEKDRARRYSTAVGLADDIRHHLANEPVEARPASTRYRLAKLMRRNRLAFGAGAAVALALMAGTIVSTWQALRANRAEREARQETAIATAVNTFLQVDLLRQADPNKQADSFETADPDLKVRDALDRAAANVGERFADQPLTEAALRLSIGESYIGLGLTAEAAGHLERAWQLRQEHLGPRHPDTLAVQLQLSYAWRDSGKAVEATALLRELVATTSDGEVDENMQIDAVSALGLALQQQGIYPEAETLFRDVLARREKREGSETPKTLVSMRNLGSILVLRGKLGEADQIHRRTLEIHRRVSGSNHPSTFAALNNVAATARQRGDYQDSFKLQEEAYVIAQRVLGEDHQDTLVSMINLGGAYRALGQRDTAIELGQAGLTTARRVLGNEHQITVTFMNNLASDLGAVGRDAEALAMRETMQGALEIAFGPDHPNTMLAMANLGNTYTKAGRLDEADQVLRESWRRLQAKLGAEHPQTLAVLALVAMNATAAADYENARALWQQCWDIRARVLGPTHPKTVDVAEKLGETLALMGQPADALAANRLVLEVRRAEGDADSPRLRAALAQFAVACLAAENAAEAEPVLRELLAVRERLEPDVWTTFNTQAMLGGALLQLDRATEAERWLISGYEGMVARRDQDTGAMNLRLAQALDRLGQLYETLRRPDDAAAWRAKQAAFLAPEEARKSAGSAGP